MQGQSQELDVTPHVPYEKSLTRPVYILRIDYSSLRPKPRPDNLDVRCEYGRASWTLIPDVSKATCKMPGAKCTIRNPSQE
jgi:hypothetical protein